MSIEASQLEVVLITLERKTMVLRSRVAAMDAYGRAAALEQGIAMSWMYAGFQNLDATLGGVVQGCAAIGFDGASITVKDHTTGTTLATATTNSGGAWSVSLTLTSNPQSLDVIASPTGYTARFTGDVTNTISAVPGSNSVGTQTFTEDTTNYVCTGAFFWPVKKTCQLVDTVNGTVSAFNWHATDPFTGLPSAWGGNASGTISFPGCGTCPPASNVNLDYYTMQVGTTTLLKFFYYYVPAHGTNCPEAALGATLFTDEVLTATMNSPSSPFQAVGNVPAGNGSKWYCGAAATYTVTEV